jgi:hypothetical protein
MKRILLFSCGFLTFLFVITCCRRNTIDNKTIEKKIDLSVERLETDMFSADPAHADSLADYLKQHYGSFFDLFVRQITNIGNIHNPFFYQSFKAFITDYNNYQIYRRVREVFPDLSKMTKDLNHAFSRYHYYFPDRPVPRIITFLSGFNYSVVSDSGVLGIGLDNYLGPEEPFYQKAGIYNYLRINMHPLKIPSDCMRLWAETEFQDENSMRNLLNAMIYEGKIMYFVKQMLPGEPDSLIWGFTSSQMKFCVNNERQMWTYLVEYKLLFTSDRFVINKFIREGPFTKDFSPESPARAATWIGYRIIEKYMYRNKGFSMDDLMKENDYQKILSLSGYNP